MTADEVVKVKVVPKTAITFTCSSCGERARFQILGGVSCPRCGKVYTFRCLVCGYEFKIGEEAEYCVRCGWLKCPRCGSCGCAVRRILGFIKKLRELVREEEGLRVFGLMSRKVIKMEKIKVRHIISIIRLDDRRKRKKKRA